MHQINTQLQHSENAEPDYSCDFLLSYLAKEIAKEYVKHLEGNKLLEAENHLEENY